jgi:phage-related protein
VDEKDVDWRGSSYKDLLAMPEKVRKTFGYALGLAQNGLRHPDTKTLTGFKPALVEILEDDDGDTYRSVYTIQFADVVYVLHCFKTKSTKDRNLPKQDRETIEARLAEVRRIEAEKARARKKS